MKVENSCRSENEKQLFDAITNKDVIGVSHLLKHNDVRINCVDEYGTTPLQQAAFKGSAEICLLLLAHGADVNNSEHQHGYSTLMFGALSGNAEVVRILLEAGARTDVTNRLGKTATEMAAFTGQHHCVSVINNFVSLDEIEYFTQPHGTDTAARLPGPLAKPLHTIIRTSNIHPVKIILMLSESDLLSYQKELFYVVEEIMEKQIKRKETNEVMALKLHIIFTVMKACSIYLNEHRDEDKPIKQKLLHYAKSLLATKDSNFPYGMEMLLRQAIKEYPFKESTLFVQILQTIAKVPIGGKPSALNVINQLLLGHMLLADETFCTSCGELKAVKRCGACKVANYCSEPCQKLHWFTHKLWCVQMAKEREAASQEQVASGADVDVTKKMEVCAVSERTHIEEQAADGSQ